MCRGLRTFGVLGLPQHASRKIRVIGRHIVAYSLVFFNNFVKTRNEVVLLRSMIAVDESRACGARVSCERVG